MRLALVGLAVIALGTWAACSDSAAPTEPTLASIQTNVFDAHCSAASCHGAEEQGGLDLRAGNSYTSLVGATPTNPVCAANGEKLVDPGNLTNSYLYHIITGELGEGEGVRMPKGGAALPQDKIDAIRQWIEAGAAQ